MSLGERSPALMPPLPPLPPSPQPPLPPTPPPPLAKLLESPLNFLAALHAAQLAWLTQPPPPPPPQPEQPMLYGNGPGAEDQFIPLPPEQAPPKPPLPREPAPPMEPISIPLPPGAAPMISPAAQYQNAVRMHPPLPPSLQPTASRAPRPSAAPSPQPGPSTYPTQYFSALVRPLGRRSVAVKRAADSTTESSAKRRCTATDRDDPRCCPECFRCMRRVLRNAIYSPNGTRRDGDTRSFIRFGQYMLFIVADRHTYRELADNNIELV